MEQNQPKQTTQVETVARPERVEKQPERRRLRLDTLESRVAPSALWGD